MVLKFLYHFLHLLFYIIGKLLFRYKTFGVEHVPKKGSAILASNHASYLDPAFVGMGIVRTINYLAKKELFSNIILRFILKDICKGLPVDREQLDRDTLREIYRLLKTDEIILLFPEGTRSYDGNLMEPKLGIGMIAYNTRSTVIPVYVNGSYNIMSRKTQFVRFKPCSVIYGSPLALESYYNQKRSKELYKTISLKIMEGIEALKERRQ
jgi:1-acyl-sn-glycerol-3-phosphate acyltransferase